MGKVVLQNEVITKMLKHETRPVFYIQIKTKIH